MQRAMLWTIGCAGLLAACAAPTTADDVDSVEGAAKTSVAMAAFEDGEYETPGLMPPFETGVFLRLGARGERRQTFELRAGNHVCSGDMVPTATGAESAQALGCKLTLRPRASGVAFDFEVEVEARKSEEFSGVAGSFYRREDAAYRRTFTGTDGRGRRLVASVSRLEGRSAGALTVTLSRDGARLLDAATLTRTAAARFESEDYTFDLAFSAADQRRTRGLVLRNRMAADSGARLE